MIVEVLDSNKLTVAENVERSGELCQESNKQNKSSKFRKIKPIVRFVASKSRGKFVNKGVWNFTCGIFLF